MANTEHQKLTKELEDKREKLASLEAEFEGWNVAVVEMATLRNRIRKLELRLTQQGAFADAG